MGDFLEKIALHAAGSDRGSGANPSAWSQGRGSCFIVIIRYFLSRCRDDPAMLGATIRAHLSIENAVHWVLDVTFRETTAECVIARRRAIWPCWPQPVQHGQCAHRTQEGCLE
jgi:hypothetical protein